MASLTLPFAGAVATDVDVFSIRNGLQEGQSDNDISGVASVVGHGGLCHGVHGDNGTGAGAAPGVGTGVWGESDNGFGVYGASIASSGVQGVSKNFDGVHGESRSDQHAGVSGINNSGGPGVWGSSSGFDGIHGESESPTNAGVAGIHTNGGIGVFGQSTGNGNAGQFAGNVLITGNLTASGDIFLPGADCAEEFGVIDRIESEPGTVLAISSAGQLELSRRPYDRRVAGVVSGAGKCNPGVVLGATRMTKERVPIALVGRVYCKADANYGAIRIGDLLTTSRTPGHAMRAKARHKAFGAVIGKALEPLEKGKGLISILVALQ